MAKKILLVDDNVDTLKVTGLMLEDQGYEIVAALSGTEAVIKAETDKPDLIFLDIMMPDLDGYGICRQIRANPATADVPILMFSAKGMPRDKEAATEAGADGYLTKPARINELVAHVEATLARARQTPARAKPAKRARVIGFLGSKGGVGTTTLAVNAAMALAHDLARDKQVILADMQPGISALALHLRLQPGAITQLLKLPVENIKTEMIEARLQQHLTGLRVLTGQIRPPGLAAPVPPGHADKIFRNLETMADYVLLDLGAGLGEANRCMLPLCHQIVLIIEPQRIALMLARGMLAELTGSLELAMHKIGLVMLHKVPYGSATFTKYSIEESLQHNLIGIVTPSPDLAFQSSETATPMFLLQPDSVVARQFRDVAEYLLMA
jgi:CheY-like chemotaxis protein/MinD-like ATPase involved in chromosome partitioning or flagellar assembly